MQRLILVVEDEKPILDILKYNLEKEGYKVATAANGEEAVIMAKQVNPDLILLDVMLPKKDGFEVCKTVRTWSQCPIIMLTAKGEETDKIFGLEIGADDYITKPFSMRELSARIKANMRRVAGDAPAQETPAETGNVIVSGKLKIDCDKYEVFRGDIPVELTLREFELLKFLAEQPEKVFSREMLLEKVWGYDFYGDMRTVDVTVSRLREKVEDDPSAPKYVMTRRGEGYYFNKNN